MNFQNAKTARNVYGRNIITRENALNKIVYGFNGHGDVVYQANTFGVVLVAYDYDEFGNVISEEDVVNSVSILLPAPVPPEDYDGELLPYQAIDNPYRYAGYEYIEEIGIYDLNARYYNPEIARFISADPYYNLHNKDNKPAEQLPQACFYNISISIPNKFTAARNALALMPFGKSFFSHISSRFALLSLPPERPRL